MIEPVPVVLICDGIPGPVGRLEVFEDDARVLVFVVRVAPYIEVARRTARSRAARALKPGMLVRSVVEDQLGNHADAAPVSLAKKGSEVLYRAVGRMDSGVICDVIAVVLQRRRIEGKQPNHRNAEVLQIVQFLGQPREIADAVIVAVEKGADVQLVNDRVLVPQRVVFKSETFTKLRHGNQPQKGTKVTVLCFFVATPFSIYELEPRSASAQCNFLCPAR